MAFQPDGTWSPENDSVTNAITGVVDKGGPLMKRAAGMGLAMANTRGLANSSMAVGASQGAVLDRATPIAGQEAQQLAEKNLAAINIAGNYKYGMDLQDKSDAAAKERLGAQITSSEKINTQQIGSAEKLADAKNVLDKELTSMGIASTEKISADQIKAAMDQLNTRIAGDITLAKQGDTAAMERLMVDTGSREKIALLDAQTSIATANIGASATMGAASINASASLEAAKLREAGDTTRLLLSVGSQSALQAAAINGDLIKQREAIAGNAAISAADRASQLAGIDKQIAGNASLAQQQSTAELAQLREKIAADTTMAAADRQARLAEIDKQTEANKQLAELQANSALTLAQFQGTNAMALQQTADMGALTRQREELAARTDISKADRDAQLATLDKTIAANRENAQLDATTKLNLGEMDAATSRANTATAATTNLNSAYMTSMAALMENEKIPADVRQNFAQSIQRATEGGVSLVNQITGTKLQWGNMQNTPPALAAHQEGVNGWTATDSNGNSAWNWFDPAMAFA